jgi:hypothetical protein
MFMHRINISRFSRQATKGAGVGAWWAGGVEYKLEGTWGVERAREQTTKRVAREPAEGDVIVTG